MLVIKNKKKFIRGIIVIIIALAIIIGMLWAIISGIISIFTKKEDKQTESKNSQISKNTVQTNQVTQASENTVPTNQITQVSSNITNNALDEWNLKLVNKDNSVSRDYVPELEELDDGIQFDKRAISYLQDMINEMYKEKITKVWVQSAYRSYEKQEELFNKKVKFYKDQGKQQEEAEELAQKLVQRPEMSEHNLALAADFNTVTNDFENTKAFEWLKEHAQDYGFILRYPKDKQDITGISYESWHWRYVGVEHAKVMKEKGYCLEEYIEYLKGAQEV